MKTIIEILVYLALGFGLMSMALNLMSAVRKVRQQQIDAAEDCEPFEDQDAAV